MTVPHPFRPLVQELLKETHAQRVLVNSELAEALVQSDTGTTLDLHKVAGAALLAGEWPHRAELAVITLAPEQGAEAMPLIAALRDLYAKRLLVFVPPMAFHWKSETLLGLGLSLLANYELEGESYQAWSFDILTYKPAPDWLNPRFWANPENWNKYRW